MHHSQQVKLQSLRSQIVESLKLGEISSGFADVLMDRSRTQVNQKDETELWDYKEELDLDNPNIEAKLAKWVLGFYNANGGVLIVGVSNDYRVLGVHENRIRDTVAIRNKVRKYIGDVQIFQGRFPTSKADRWLWAIFVPKRNGPPQACLENGPVVNGKSIVQREKYYIRRGDETVTCISPNDFERLFHGFSFKHLNAYTYEVDEPYFRLLAPHHPEFVERNSLMNELQNAFATRSYIIALDGVGGAGKSALAIELVRRFYRSRHFDFIVSLSAKNKIWTTHSSSTQANFSGFTELLGELAKVLDIPFLGKSLDDLKLDVINFMQGVRGLLLIDNLEEITDASVFQFLKNEVPEPVKILVTSRISRNLGARTISVPEMTRDEAITLLRKELDRIDRTDLTLDAQAIEEIVIAAGHLPLAIKWAASLAANATSLRQVSSELRKHDSTKQEFLDFCFSTMYADLSESARKVALLCPYLRFTWNRETLSLALDQPPSKIVDSIKELENKGLLLSPLPSKEGALSIHPLTLDFLSQKWAQSKAFKGEVMDRLARAVAATDTAADWLDLPSDQKVELLQKKARDYEGSQLFDKALSLIRIALQCANKPRDIIYLRFSEGRITYKSSDWHLGIAMMKSAHSDDSEKVLLSEDLIFLASALLFHGERRDEQLALELAANRVTSVREIPNGLIEEFIRIALARRNFEVIFRLLSNVNEPEVAYSVVSELWQSLDNRQILHALGGSIVKAIRIAETYKWASDEEKSRMKAKLAQIEIRN